MDFYEVVYKKINKTADRTIKSASKLTSVAKLKFNLMREKAALDEAYRQLGESYYKELKNIDYDDGKISLAYDNIEKSVCEIDRLTREIDALNSQSEVVDEQAVKSYVEYCPKCGKRKL